jgi:hypothetical protein
VCCNRAATGNVCYLLPQLIPSFTSHPVTHPNLLRPGYRWQVQLAYTIYAAKMLLQLCCSSVAALLQLCCSSVAENGYPRAQALDIEAAGSTHPLLQLCCSTHRLLQLCCRQAGSTHRKQVAHIACCSSVAGKQVAHIASR